MGERIRMLGAPCSGIGLLSDGNEGTGGDSTDGNVRSGEPAVGTALVLRDPRTAIGALVQAWESRVFAHEEQPPGWWGVPWAFDLIDGWEDLVNRPLAEICARQWLTLELEAIASAGSDPAVITFEDLVTDPRRAETMLAEKLGVAVTVGLEEPLDPRTMMFQADEVLAGISAWPVLAEEYLAAAEGLGAVGYRDPLPTHDAHPAAETTAASEGTPFASGSTPSFAELLHVAGASVLVTTYKAGQAVVLRTTDGHTLDTYFTPLERPMGSAIAGNRMAIGTADSIVTYLVHDASASVALDPAPDAVLVPKAQVFTGDVAIHDMAWDADGELWFVNTQFSCLSTMRLHESFDVRWRPDWISALAPEDRCHLNGLAMVDGRPAFVTALARTDAAHGWREHRGTGGVIVDIREGSVVADGLAMPHSPRWYDDRLWFLESGKGALNVRQTDGSITEIVRLPGFTRGLAFLGPYAFVGLSQVRESVFTGLPVTESVSERNCGVWIVDIRNGDIVGFLRFEANITELFDVQVLGVRWPHIADRGIATSMSFALDEQTLADLSTDSSLV